jgi:hypothetical protein
MITPVGQLMAHGARFCAASAIAAIALFRITQNGVN